MIRLAIVIIFSLYSSCYCYAQEYIGKHKEEVKKMMSMERKDVYLDESSTNTVYNLLKYVDRNGTQTILIVFDDKDTCKYYKSIYDYSWLKKIEKELNRKYSMGGKGTWYVKENNDEYQISLKKDKWYFSVLVKKITVPNN